ncbi:MAG TPA: ABC transporter permease subunit [Chloroflexi bacterium]|nr:ABC transporter permease subunit [Chloroflexota bacterium]
MREVPLPAHSVTTEQNLPPARQVIPTRQVLVRALRGLGSALLTLLMIAYLTLFGLIMAERGRERLPAEPVTAAVQALQRVGEYIFAHPDTYYWHNHHQPAFELVRTTLGNSAGLLLTAMLIAVILGIGLGTAAALSKGKGSPIFVLSLSILGMSTPSFLFGMLVWIANITIIHRGLGLTALPQTGFGWDTHLIMPALVLAARPLAQIAQITYVSLTDVLGQDFIRTARAKGVGHWRLHFRHAFRNVLIPVLTTVGTSLRYSLASLPVVETFFHWPGVGITLLEAIDAGLSTLITDLILGLGLFFLVFNLLIDLLYPWIDPQLRSQENRSQLVERFSLRETLNGMRESLSALIRWRRRTAAPAQASTTRVNTPASDPAEARSEVPAASRSRSLRRGLSLLASNPAFTIGLVLVSGLVFLTLFGSSLTPNNPFQIHGVTRVDGVYAAPPFKPSSMFAWGTDHIGRDVQAFVLAGARQTLLLAFITMLARLALGSLLGLMAGWWQHSRIDRLVTRLMDVWAAFPLTLFAMILIQALGIQQGTWVFVTALCVVGWGEVAQFVRSQTLRIKPQLYIEAARALGASPLHMLARQVLPNLLPSLLVIASLEMGGILMLLAELGYLNIFLGGGYRMELIVNQVVHFSDVPEWGAMLANIREWWRSYPWMAWYPAAAFFLAIFSFNLFGEGLRRFIEDSRLNFSRLFNRYTLIGALVAAAVFTIAWRSGTPINQYRSQAQNFVTANALVDIEVLSSPAFGGRETGHPSTRAVAEYIARRMAEVGLFPGFTKDEFIQEIPKVRSQMVDLPYMRIPGPDGEMQSLVYHRDFVESVDPWRIGGDAAAETIGLAIGPPGEDSKVYARALSAAPILDRVVIVRAEDAHLVPDGLVAGIIIIEDGPYAIQKKFFPLTTIYRDFTTSKPMVMVTREVADRLLQRSNSSVAELEAAADRLKVGEIHITEPGGPVEFGNHFAPFQENINFNVIGLLPGTGANTPSSTPGVMMDRKAIVLAAHFDGVGTSPDGTLYPGANDNASGVAAMLEIARVLREGPYEPKKTIIFVAWSGAERLEQLSLIDMLNASRQLSIYDIEAVIELSGIGAGTSDKIAIGENSSYRLIRLFQSAAGKMGASTTTRGRGPHYGLPLARLAIDRQVPSLYISWDGSDLLAHTPLDSPDNIDPLKLQRSGESTLLTLLTLSREITY